MADCSHTCELVHHISIRSSIENVYLALTTEEEIKGWWTDGVILSQRVGGDAVFTFASGARHLRMIIEKLDRPFHVRWSCEGGTLPGWIGTTLDFELKPQSAGSIFLDFRHAGWKASDDERHFCNTMWGHLFVILQEYVEKGARNPYWQ